MIFLWSQWAGAAQTAGAIAQGETWRYFAFLALPFAGTHV